MSSSAPIELLESSDDERGSANVPKPPPTPPQVVKKKEYRGARRNGFNQELYRNCDKKRKKTAVFYGGGTTSAGAPPSKVVESSISQSVIQPLKADPIQSPQMKGLQKYPQQPEANLHDTSSVVAPDDRTKPKKRVRLESLVSATQLKDTSPKPQEGVGTISSPKSTPKRATTNNGVAAGTPSSSTTKERAHSIPRRGLVAKFSAASTTSAANEDKQKKSSSYRSCRSSLVWKDSDEDDGDDLIDSLLERPVGKYCQIDPPKSLNYMKHHCWSCHEWIEHPTSLESTAKRDSRTGEMTYCCYLMHEHPILGVPVCVVCSEAIEGNLSSPPTGSPIEGDHDQLKDKANSNSQKFNEMNMCVGCGQHVSNCSNPEWFLCDNDCSRVFCHHCVAQAHGNASIVETIIQDKNKGYQCCACTPPDFLKQLQEYTRHLQSKAEEMVAASMGDDTKPPSQEALDDVVAYLQLVEDRKDECDSILNNMSKELEDIRLMIEQDENSRAWVHREREDRILHEQEAYDKAWVNHRTRLADTIATTQDYLLSVYGVESRKIYEKLKGSENIAGIQTEEGDEPEWKRAADAFINKMEGEYKKCKKKKGEGKIYFNLKDPRYKLDYTDDVEELGDRSSSEDEDGKGGSDSEDSYSAYRSGWRNATKKATKDEVDEAMEEEGERYKELNIAIKTCNRAEEKLERRNWVRSLKPVKRRRIKRNKKGSHQSSPGTRKTQSSDVARKQRTLESDSDTSDDGSHGDGVVAAKSAKKSKSFVLSRRPLIAVAQHFDKSLKKHQREGIEFMFKNSFADLGGDTKADVGGCVLAHSMGLGKTFSVIALLHALMFLPKPQIRKVLLVVPVNTLANWEIEFAKWTEGLEERFNVYNVGESLNKLYREKILQRWIECGGIVLISDSTFRSSMKHSSIQEKLVKPDAIVLDESHTMLKNTENLLFKELQKVETNRRLCLTGTPFQNNLLEYFRMLSYIRPGLLGHCERKFQKEYVDPINAGMAKDAMLSLKTFADELIQKITEEAAPYIHRRDATVLVNELPSLQQVVLHVRPTKTQRGMYACFRKYQKLTNTYNFFQQFSTLRPIHNHPATILMKLRDKSKTKQGVTPEETEESQAKVKEEEFTVNADGTGRDRKTPPLRRSSLDEIIELLSDSDDEEIVEGDSLSEDLVNSEHWAAPLLNKMGAEKLNMISNGNKCVILLHILVQAHKLGEKTLVFSQSLRTLDFLSEMLTRSEWTKDVPSLHKSYPDDAIGGWKEGVDFVRIDGRKRGDERGELVKDFASDGNIKLFLISILAGSLGINLTSATRVVLFDSHFNPTVDLQAIFRTYRYGQTKPVFCYRLLTQGSMEEKVYSRAVTKSGLAGRVIDGKTLSRLFNKDELDSMSSMDDWVECDRCKQWRMIPPDAGIDVTKLPDKWFCEMLNPHDCRLTWTCKIPEKDIVWYHRHFAKPKDIPDHTSPKPTQNGGICTSQELNRAIVPSSRSVSDEPTKELVDRDSILKNLLNISINEKQVVTKHYFHDALVTEKDSDRLQQNNSSSELTVGALSRPDRPDTLKARESKASKTDQTQAFTTVGVTSHYCEKKALYRVIQLF